MVTIHIFNRLPRPKSSPSNIPERALSSYEGSRERGMGKGRRAMAPDFWRSEKFSAHGRLGARVLALGKGLAMPGRSLAGVSRYSLGDRIPASLPSSTGSEAALCYILLLPRGMGIEKEVLRGANAFCRQGPFLLSIRPKEPRQHQWQESFQMWFFSSPAAYIRITCQKDTFCGTNWPIFPLNNQTRTTGPKAFAQECFLHNSSLILYRKLIFHFTELSCLFCFNSFLLFSKLPKRFSCS